MATKPSSHPVQVKLEYGFFKMPKQKKNIVQFPKQALEQIAGSNA
jgi:hypothetical protein